MRGPSNRLSRRLARLVSAAAVVLAGAAQGAWASDACSVTAIRAVADVAVSDGTSFRTESLFHSLDHASIRHDYADAGEQVVAVEGPLAWVRTGTESAAGTDFHKLFALGHQYHAFLLQPSTILTNLHDTAGVALGGTSRAALSGDYPYGGVVHIVQGDTPARPAGLVFEFGAAGRIEVSLSDWRPVGDAALPFLAVIDDGTKTFDYRYSTIEIAPRAPLWFYDALPAPALDAVRIHRLHRRLLAAHCLGDADLIADLSTGDVISASSGELRHSTNDELRARFTSLFETLDYAAYEDLEAPVIEVSASGDLGWVAVEVRATGAVRASGAPFASRWAWIMVAEKVDGAWLHAGNASSVARE